MCNLDESLPHRVAQLFIEGVVGLALANALDRALLLSLYFAVLFGISEFCYVPAK
jgi:hypothetical protein